MRYVKKWELNAEYNMTQEQEKLLLKDLCARLPYGVVIQEKCVEHDETFLANKEGDRLVNIDAHADLLMTNSGSWYYLDEIKPYLFSLDKISGDMWTEYLATCVGGNASFPTFKSFEWCYENHIDFRGLIPNGLALDATGKNIY